MLGVALGQRLSNLLAGAFEVLEPCTRQKLVNYVQHFAHKEGQITFRELDTSLFLPGAMGTKGYLDALDLVGSCCQHHIGTL